jgi:hypothetical protein
MDPVSGPARVAAEETDSETSVLNRVARTGPFLLAAGDGRRAVGETTATGEQTSTTTALGAFN